MGDNGFHSIFFVLRLLCLFVAINCRFQDKYLLGGAMSCSGNLARAFSPHFVFRFDTWSVAPGTWGVAPGYWGVAPGWDEDAPLALRRHQPASSGLTGRRE